ncbi:unnamed protein product [Paramecium pentaurelia]|uniref:Uncharacterized protein n=1 Tax=Paramecium pentaurelia TaxID=43138 RepID=A0A8S1XLH6_9CILI|nr:unnamed protein product [Paramecium pentaurelia]
MQTRNIYQLLKKFFYFTIAIANKPNNINFKKQMNQEISQFIEKVFLINCLEHPNNYNMVEYIIGEQLITLQQDQIKNIQTDVNELIKYDYYQITNSHQNQSLLHSNHSQSDKESYHFQYIDYKIEENLNELKQESAILDINPFQKNELEFQSECGLEQFNTFVETNFLTDYKFIMKKHLDSKNNSSSIRTSFQYQ